MIPLRDLNPTARRPVVTYVLLALNVGVFAYQLSLGAVADQELVFRFGMVPRYLTSEFQLHSLSTPFTSMFMHGGFMHLISNMWFLFVFGDNVEDRLGRGRFLVFYLACGLLAALSQVLVEPGSSVPMVGASGAIAGVLGAYLRLFPSAQVVTLIPLFIFFFVREVPALFFIVVWFLFQLAQGVGSLGIVVQQGGVAFFAHIGGFLAGVLLLRAFGATAARTRASRGYRIGRGRPQEPWH